MGALIHVQSVMALEGGKAGPVRRRAPLSRAHKTEQTHVVGPPLVRMVVSTTDDKFQSR